MKAQKFVLAKQFSGIPTEENIKLVEYELDDNLKDGEVLFQSVYLSVDPYMRLFFPKEGDVMNGEHLAEVIKTKNGQFPIGTLVLSKAGWQSHYVSKGEETNPISFDLGATRISLTLGTLGMPGATAYLGLEKCDLKAGETLLVTAAAGAVGHVVGQLAKLKGCTVIGVVGSEEKAKWCKEELGFDHVLNYKACDYSEELSKVAPEGVDVYWDHVGGDYYPNIINKHMKMGGRVLVVGSISNYNDTEQKLYPATNVSILTKGLTVKAFQVFGCVDQYPRAFTEMNKLIQENKLKTREQVYEGFDKMFEAFMGLFKGENIGKVVVMTENKATHYGKVKPSTN